MKTLLWIPLLAFSLTACGVSRADYGALQAENADLETEVMSFPAQVTAARGDEAGAPVVLANTESRTLRSALNGQSYEIKVKFPRHYDTETRSYPVLYVTDAETNFGGVSYIVQRLIKDHQIPEVLVVGVAYDTDYDTFYKLRSRDLTPVAVSQVTVGGEVIKNPTGGAPVFARFLAEELFPFIEKNYRVKPEDRALYGHSYGGLFGTYVLLHHPELFNRYLLLSPSLWFDHLRLLNEVKTVDLHFASSRLYMGSGRLEPRIDDFQEDFVRSLRGRKPEGLAIRSEVFENETHRTVFGTGFTNGLRYLYGSSDRTSP